LWPIIGPTIYGDNLVFLWFFLIATIGYSTDFNECTTLQKDEREECLLKKSQELDQSEIFINPFQNPILMRKADRKWAISSLTSITNGQVIDGTNLFKSGQFVLLNLEVGVLAESRSGHTLSITLPATRVSSTGLNDSGSTSVGRPSFLWMVPIIDAESTMWQIGPGLKFPLFTVRSGNGVSPETNQRNSEAGRVWEISLNSQLKQQIKNNFDLLLDTSLHYNTEYNTTYEDSNFSQSSMVGHYYQRPLLLKAALGFQKRYSASKWGIKLKHLQGIGEGHKIVTAQGDLDEASEKISLSGIEIFCEPRVWVDGYVGMSLYKSLNNQTITKYIGHVYEDYTHPFFDNFTEAAYIYGKIWFRQSF
jgi:hypothetical protein